MQRGAWKLREQFKRLHGGKLQPRKKERIEGIQDSAFLLNEAARFAKGTDAAQIRENFRKYVEDVNSGNEAARQAAQEGACRDLEFFIISILSRKFSTYVEKDRGFFEDLVQAGWMGIIAALAKYNPDKGMPTTYFFPISCMR